MKEGRPTTSIIIRTKNEGETFNKVLSALKSQIYQDFELVIVDDNSTDSTDSLPLKYFTEDRIRLVTVPEGKFTHPYSCNLGAENAQGEFLIYINGHAIPVSDSWLKDGLSNFTDQKVAGVFAYSKANPEANLLERVLFNSYTTLFHSQKKIYRKKEMGVMGTTNAIIRKSLWEQYHFNEDYPFGGEDLDWINHWFKQGYIAIHDPGFRVYHSHNLGPIELIHQFILWRKMGKPSIGQKPRRAGYHLK